MRSRSTLSLSTSRQILLLGLVVVAIALFGHEAARPVHAVGEGTFSLNKTEYVTQEGTAFPVVVNRTGGSVLTQDVVVTVQLSGGTVDEDYPSGTITQPFTFKAGTNLSSTTPFFFQTLNKSRYFTKTITVTILSVSSGGQIDFGRATAPVRIQGIFAPTVTSVSPRSGNAGGAGPVVFLTGTNFVPSCGGVTINAGDPPCTDSVYFYPTTGGSPVVVTPFSIQSRTLISFLAPSALGSFPNGAAFHVVVGNQTGAASPNPAFNESVRTDADLFTYASGAAVTSVVPSGGPASGGTTVTLTGNAALNCGAPGAGNTFPAVTFGGAPYYATDCLFVSSTGTGGGTVNVITLKSPVHPPGTVDVSVFGSPPTQETKYTYTGGPQVTAITPAFGPQSGGTSVIISGSGFLAQLPGPSVRRVFFGGNEVVSPLFQTDNQITAIAPAGAGVQQVTVRTTLGDSPFTTNANFSYTSGPIILSMSPVNGPVTGGTIVTIGGSGFLPGSTVRFGLTPATAVFVDSSGAIRAVAPAGVGNVDVVVSANGIVSPNTAADNYSYTGPTISLLTPNAGPVAGGNPVVITGQNFTSGSTVTFGALAAPPAQVTFISPNQLSVIAPTNTVGGAVDVRVTTISGQSPIVPEGLYTYTSGPIVDALNPATGPTTGGSIVIITGKNFTAGLTIKFGDVNVDNLNVNSATQITLLTPPAASAGVKDVRVTKGADTSPISATAKFTYVAAVPIITAIEPNSAATIGGQEVTIIGAGFSGVVCPGAVKFGTVPAVSCTMVNDTTLKAVAPPNVSGQTVVTVTTTNGTSDIVPNFTYKSSGSGGGTTPPPPGPAGTIAYSLTFRWTLLTWFGRDGIAVGDALRGYPPTAGSDITTRISAIFRWDAANAVYKGYFTLAEGIPGANDFTTLTRGAVYWVATISLGDTTWTVQTG